MPLASSMGMKRARVARFTAADDFLPLAGWWPDGKGVLFWRDPGVLSSGDGLGLFTLQLGGKPRQLRRRCPIRTSSLTRRTAMIWRWLQGSDGRCGMTKSWPLTSEVGLEEVTSAAPALFGLQGALGVCLLLIARPRRGHDGLAVDVHGVLGMHRVRTSLCTSLVLC
jgi:hypothetical protein